MAVKIDKPEPAHQPADDGVLLELAMYTNYTWQGETYTKGKAYRFRKDDAIQLLGQQDAGRPVWKQYRPARKTVEPSNIVDATTVKVKPVEEPIHAVPEKRIDVGTDDEIADILNRDDGNVTL